MRLSWIGQGTAGDTRFGLHSIPLDGSGPGAFLELPARTQSMTVHEGTVYYAQSHPDYDGSSIFTTDIQGGNRTPLYEIDRRATTWGFVVTGDHLYLSDSLYDTIRRTDLAGGHMEFIFESGASPSPAYMTGTPDQLFWLQFAVSSRGSSGIWTLDYSDPATAAPILESLGEPRYLSSNSFNLFWFDSMDRNIYRSDFSGQNLQVVVSSTWARGLVVDDDYLYWANNTNLLRSDLNGENIELILVSESLIGSLYLETIPEPGTLLLGITGALLLLGHRRRSV